MIKTKKKVCCECNELKPIWKNHKGCKYCKYCWYKLKDTKQTTFKPKHIKQKSKKREVQDTIYLKLRTIFLNKNKFCVIRGHDCMIHSSDVHHTHDGADREEHYLDVGTWLSTCRKCHDWIHANPKQAKELGYLK